MSQPPTCLLSQFCDVYYYFAHAYEELQQWANLSVRCCAHIASLASSQIGEMEPRDSRIPSSSPLLGNKLKKLLRFFINFLNKKGKRSNLCLVLKSGRSGTVVKRNDPLFEDLGNSFARDYKMYPHRLTGQPPETSCTKKIETKDRIRKNKAKQSQLLESFH